MGFVDVSLSPFYTWFYTYETCGKFSWVPEGGDLGKLVHAEGQCIQDPYWTTQGPWFISVNLVF